MTTIEDKLIEVFVTFSDEKSKLLSQLKLKTSPEHMSEITIECNHIFASLISNNIFNRMKFHSEKEFRCFSKYPYAEAAKLIFGVLQGNIIAI
jgi:hypothetical protein